MKIVVIGGTGLVGRQLVVLLSGQGHEAIAAAPSTGVDTLSGAGLADALAKADAVVDVSNAPSFEDAAVLDFFTRSASNLMLAVRAAERAALAEFVGTWLGERDDPRAVTFNDSDLYFGAAVDDATLVPSEGARIMPTRFDAWLSTQHGLEAA